MFAQVQLILLGVLLTETLCAPGVYRVGFSHEAKGSTDFHAGAGGKGSLDHGVLDGSGGGKLAASGSGGLTGSVFVQNNDKIYEGQADYYGSAGGYINPTAGGKIGKDTRDGKLVLNGKTGMGSDSLHSGAGSMGMLTDEDALQGFNSYRNRDAHSILKSMAMDNSDY